MAIYAILTAIFWAITYCSTGQVVKYMDVKTYLVISSLFSLTMYGLWGYADNTLLKTNQFNLKGLGFALLSAFAAFVASYCSVSAVKHGGVVLASIIEISYPCWCVLFLYMFGQIDHLDWHIVVGGLMIFSGTVVVLLGTNHV